MDILDNDILVNLFVSTEEQPRLMYRKKHQVSNF